MWLHQFFGELRLQQRALFLLLLKVVVKGSHQCEYINFWGASVPTHSSNQLQPNWGCWQHSARHIHPGLINCKTTRGDVRSWCWQLLESKLPLKKFCYGWLHRRLLRRYRPQSAVNCSTLWERAAGSPPNTSQVSLLAPFTIFQVFH